MNRKDRRIAGRSGGSGAAPAEAPWRAGRAALARGDIAGAIDAFGRAVALEPGAAVLHHALAEAHRAARNPAQAELHYRRAAELQPEAATLLNHANALLECGRLDEAVQAYRASLRRDAAVPETHYSLGNALAALRAPAAEAYAKALALRPDYADAHEALAEHLIAAGALEQAWRAACRGLLQVDTPKLRGLFVTAIMQAPPGRDLPGLRGVMRRALAERWTRPRDLARAAGWIVALREPPDLRDLLLRDVLALAPLSHAGLERALVAARRGLLDAALAGGGLDAAALEDACALARQGFLNEYVWECSAAELAATDALAGLLAAQLARNEVPAAGLLMALAMYRPLGLLPGAALVAADVPAVASVLAQQITEPAEEARLRAALPRATAIDGAVSAAVREQYEANPYPRWGVLPGEMRRVRLADWLGGQFPGVAMPALPDAPEVLVAGCGTGQHPIELARRFADLRLTAMDLSAASLGYAARMAAQAGVAIEFLQGDLLRVHELGRQFDVIEASGVLHHLADPWAGWRALLGVLRPGGVMNVSLYTQRGRADVRRARARIGELGLAPTLDGIRACRRDLAALDEDWARRLALSPDFAAASGCRDLLFHVQEQALGLPEIAAFLDEAGLVLLGVDAALPTRLAFQAWCGAAAGAARGLARWDAFEAEHPGCFAGMVHLWVAKPAV